MNGAVTTRITLDMAAFQHREPQHGPLPLDFPSSLPPSLRKGLWSDLDPRLAARFFFVSASLRSKPFEAIRNALKRFSRNEPLLLVVRAVFGSGEQTTATLSLGFATSLGYSPARIGEAQRVYPLLRRLWKQYPPLASFGKQNARADLKVTHRGELKPATSPELDGKLSPPLNHRSALSLRAALSS